jgi:hypothetical protein
MAIEGEFSTTLETIQCMDCNADLPVGVFQSGAGYYIGRWCNNCGPYERMSYEYWATREEATEVLKEWDRNEESMEQGLRDTDYHEGDFTVIDYPSYDPQVDHFEKFGRPAFPNEY